MEKATNKEKETIGWRTDMTTANVLKKNGTKPFERSRI
jgi:hypothetical protein